MMHYTDYPKSREGVESIPYATRVSHTSTCRAATSDSDVIANIEYTLLYSSRPHMTANNRQ
ncbi:hypothetical protein J6590_000991 [Homalodisca vitripennis]|nr:hypothetical protein J6590_000991 [Homalodisca vitripennis]